MNSNYISTFLTDFRLIYRDSSLRSFLMLPFVILIVVRFGMPYLIGLYPAVEEYVLPLIIICSIETTQLFCFLYAMIFIEEKETNTNIVYGILPVSLSILLMSRFALPMVITMVINLILLLIQPFYDLPFIQSLLYSIVASMIVPIYAIGVSIFSKNKMQGLVWVKAFNILIVLPIIYLLTQSFWINLFAVFPSFWLFHSLESIIIQDGWFLLHITISFVFLTVILSVFISLFNRRHYRE